MNYQQTIDYLFSQLPMFQRVGSAAYKANLDNTIAICSLLGNPERKFRSIHVAGTNGKGSTSHMLAAILQARGLKVGLYTSPHLRDFRERIRINGEMIPGENVVQFVAKYKSDFERISPSFFEMTVGLAFEYFADEKVDIAVIEVGLGGRLDSTNVILPELSVITNISYDHTALLGNTLEAIAGEKAGVIKHGIPVVIGETQEQTAAVFIEKAKKENAPLLFADQRYRLEAAEEQGDPGIWDVFREEQKVMDRLSCGLKGRYQRKNLATVLTAVDELNRLGFGIEEEHVRKGISNVVSLTGLLGRWQELSRHPRVIADTGHNEAGIAEVLEQLRGMKYRKLLMVIGMVNDKEIGKVLEMLPKDADYFFCRASIPRALDAQELAAKAAAEGLHGSVHKTVKDALAAAVAAAGDDDLVFVGGSTFVVAEVV